MYIPFIQRCFVPSLVEIGLMVLEKKCTSTVSLFLQLQKGITLQSYKYFLKVIITTNVKIMCIQKLTPCEEAEVLVFCHRERERERERERDYEKIGFHLFHCVSKLSHYLHFCLYQVWLKLAKRFWRRV